MKKNILRKILMLVVALTLAFHAAPAMAQSSGDRLYSQGLELQKTQTVKSQQAAIAKFQSAKKLYDSAAKKKQCDDAIAVSNSIISSLKSTPKGGSAKTKVADTPAPTTLEVSNEQFQLDCEQHSVTVTVTTNEQDWTPAAVSGADGASFLTIKPNHEQGTFDIVCPANTSTRARTQIVEVRAGNLKKEVAIEQAGKPTVLAVEKSVVEFSRKGGTKSIEVYSNSDSTEPDNNQRNWRVVQKPDWVSIIGEEKKEKGVFGQIADSAKGLVKSTNTSIAADPTIVTSVMKIVVGTKDKTSSSRSGEIIIASENQQVTIIIQQK